jgi:hypothetical protein
MIVLTSALVQYFKDDELAFVIGHEIGHLIYLHSQIGMVGRLLSNPEAQNYSPFIHNLIVRWGKYAEISCDRIGYIAMPNIETVGKVFFKLASGLSEEHLNFNIREYLNQLEKIKEISQSEFNTSHPNNLIRLRCLELFSQSEIYTDCGQIITQNELQDELLEVLNLLEFHPQSEDQKQAVEFIAAVGMYIADIDTEHNPNEMERIYNTLSYFTSQPEIYLDFKDREDMIARKDAILDYYSKSNSDYKNRLVEEIVCIVMCDGKMCEAEKSALFEIAQKVNITDDTMRQIIVHYAQQFKVRIGNLQAGNPGGTGVSPFSFKKPE